MTHTTKHTPGPSCTCQVRHHRHDTGIGVMEETDINICPFHAAAPAMYLELKEGLVLLEASHHDMVDMYGTDSLQAKTVWERIESTRNTLAQAEGK